MAVRTSTPKSPASRAEPAADAVRPRKAHSQRRSPAARTGAGGRGATTAKAADLRHDLSAIDVEAPPRGAKAARPVPRTTWGATTTTVLQPAASGDGGVERRTPFIQTIRQSPDEEPPREQEAAEEEPPLEAGEIAPTEAIVASSLDSVSSTISHKPSVSEGGASPPGFGVTRSAAKMSNAVVTHAGTVFTLTADFVHTITWKVRSGTGPASQKDIASETNADITSTNYPTVVSDLTPNPSDLMGRPPRTKFWAEDITKTHEIFHTKQRSGKFGDEAAKAIKTSLDAKTAATEAEVKALLPGALNDGVTAMNALITATSTESDAYKDGAPLYTARADAIKKRGDKGLY